MIYLFFFFNFVVFFVWFFRGKINADIIQAVFVLKFQLCSMCVEIISNVVSEHMFCVWRNRFLTNIARTYTLLPWFFCLFAVPVKNYSIVCYVRPCQLLIAMSFVSDKYHARLRYRKCAKPERKLYTADCSND